MTEDAHNLALRKHLAGAKIALCVAMKNLHEGKPLASYSSINLAMLEMTRAQRILREDNDRKGKRSRSMRTRKTLRSQRSTKERKGSSNASDS